MTVAVAGLRPGVVVPLLVALVAAGCVASGPGVPTRSRDGVGILVAPTQPPPRDGELASVGCATGLTDGVLVADADTGVVLVADGTPTPIVWPAGYTARRIGADIQVLDVAGRVVATTGEAIHVEGGAIDGGGIRWWACDGGIAPVTSE